MFTSMSWGHFKVKEGKKRHQESLSFQTSSRCHSKQFGFISRNISLSQTAPSLKYHGSAALHPAV